MTFSVRDLTGTYNLFPQLGMRVVCSLLPVKAARLERLGLSPY